MEQKDLGKKSYDLYFIKRVHAPIRDFFKYFHLYMRIK